jgi:DNA-binding response OmpR family regulator
MRVLLVEDEVRLAENLAAALRDGPGFAVDWAEDGLAGDEYARNQCYDLIMLDLMLPRLDGLSLLKRVRGRRDTTPVLILTAKDGADSIIQLLNAGADDYLAKPFDLGELIARAKALIRRGKGAAHPTLTALGLEVNTLEQSVRRGGVFVDLSPTEYRILEYLIHRPRVIVSKRELLEHLYDFNWEHHSNVIEAHVSNLRKKLDSAAPEADPVIETMRGRGYRLAPDVPAPGWTPGSGPSANEPLGSEASTNGPSAEPHPMRRSNPERAQ